MACITSYRKNAWVSFVLKDTSRRGWINVFHVMSEIENTGGNVNLEPVYGGKMMMVMQGLDYNNNIKATLDILVEQGIIEAGYETNIQ